MALSDETVRAAGGIVVRHLDPAEPEVLLVHRPRYDDWTFPKGKAHPGESDEACALREVEEETGLRCTIERELSSTRYLDQKGRPKLVRYYRMRPLSSTFAPHDEVDEIRWLPLGQARALLSYEHDRRLIDEL